MGEKRTQSKLSTKTVNFSDFYFTLYKYFITSLLFHNLVANLVYKNKKKSKKTYEIKASKYNEAVHTIFWIVNFYKKSGWLQKRQWGTMFEFI